MRGDRVRGRFGPIGGSGRPGGAGAPGPDRRRGPARGRDAAGGRRLSPPRGGGSPEGQRYAFRLDGGPERPDPCSLWQPEGVHGPSAVVRPDRFAWTDGGWKGVRREDLVFYELHVGTFTPEGTFEAIIPRLRDLRELGVTAVEIMPVGQFPGTRNWGYDGVLPYAAQDSYGGPHGLQRLVDACHAEGLAIFLDVVYNHFGPEGNYLGEFGPYFNDRYKTPVGRRGQLRRPRLRRGARLRAGQRPDVAGGVPLRRPPPGRRRTPSSTWARGTSCGRSRKWPRTCRSRRGWPAIVDRRERPQRSPRCSIRANAAGTALDAQWADDFHHAAHAFFTGERDGYYADFGEARATGQGSRDARSCTPWDYSPFRGRKHGAPPEGLSGDRFVVCLQNHDQVGNRAGGDRLNALLGSPAKQRLAAGLLLLSPYLPLLFMGEEYGEENPFPFFCSFGDPELVEAVREGRKKEFEAFTWQGEVPDPQGEETFASARLSWSWPEGTHRAGLRRLYRDLLTARREWPALRDFEHRSARLVAGRGTRPVLELVRGGRRRVDAGAVQPRRPDRPGSRAMSTAGHRSCSARRPPSYGGEPRGRAGRRAGPVRVRCLGPPFLEGLPRPRMSAARPGSAVRRRIVRQERARGGSACMTDPNAATGCNAEMTR